jgi:hypothetical protein
MTVDFEPVPGSFARACLGNEEPALILFHSDPVLISKDNLSRVLARRIEPKSRLPIRKDRAEQGVSWHGDPWS